MVGDGTINGQKARVGAIAIVGSGNAVVGLLAATGRDFEELGGTQLVISILGTMKATTSASAERPQDARRARDRRTGAGLPITQPVLDHYGSLIVPPLDRKVELSELVGEWRNDGAGIKSYVNSGTGTYAGFSSAQTTDDWTIDAKGDVFNIGTYAVANEKGAHGGTVKQAGTASLDANMVLTVRWKDKGDEVHYLIRGWVELPAITVLNLNGPYYAAGVPADVIANPKGNAYLDKLWARKRATK